MVEAVHFVDEKDIPGLEACENGGQVSGSFKPPPSLPMRPAMNRCVALAATA